MTDEELKQIFGSLYELIPLHQGKISKIAASVAGCID